MTETDVDGDSRGGGGEGAGEGRKRRRDDGAGGGKKRGDENRGSGSGGKDVMDLFACPPSPSDYVHMEGLRVVRPYPFDFVCHVKKRMEGLDVVDMFAREFPVRPKTYYQAAHRRGLLRVEPMPNAKAQKKGGAGKRSESGKNRDANSGGGGGGGGGRGGCGGGGGGGNYAIDDDDAAAAAAAVVSKESRTGKQLEAAAAAAVEPLRPLCAGERVRHALHRHEPPALDLPVTVVAETPDVVAIHKPATYRKNTVVGILAAERPDLGRLLPVHRLDKNVSGLLLMARHPAAANSLREQVQGHEVRKEYLALVAAKHVATGASVVDLFRGGSGGSGIEGVSYGQTVRGGGGDDDGGGTPSATAVGSPEPRDARELKGVEGEDRCAGRAGGEVGDARETANEMTVTVTAGVRYDERERVATCSTPAAPVEGAKEASTRFTLVAVAPPAAAEATTAGTPALNPPGLEPTASSTAARVATVYHHPLLPPGTALVRCRPLTGRTHQIRVHLSFLGHPIANDAAYGGFHPGDRARGEELVRLCGRLVMEEKKDGVERGGGSGGGGGASGCVVVADGPVREGEGCSAEWPLCAHCPRVVHGMGIEGGGGGDEGGGGGGGGGRGGDGEGCAQRPPDLERIWLHCSKYSGALWSFQCPDPPWLPPYE